jgi:DNA replication and repair protein RecF
VETLLAVPAQVLVTGTEIPRPLQPTQAKVFHVEQGSVSPLL